MDIEKFSECCLAKVCRDNEGHVRLTMCCVLRDPDTGRKVVHKKEVNLDGLISYAHKALMKYHQGLHGSGQPQVSGEWDDLLNKAYQAARRMGEARLVKALFSEISPELGSNAKGPDDEESEMHRQAHEVLVKAREGDRTALDIMSALMNSAYRGNERALEIMTLMRDMHHAMDGKVVVQTAGYHCAGMTTPQLIEIGSWWSSIKNAAKKVGKVATAPIWAPTLMAYKMAKGDFRGALNTAKGAVGDTWDLTKDVAKVATAPIWAPAYATYKGVQAVSNALSPGGGDDGGAPPPAASLPPGPSGDGSGYDQSYDQSYDPGSPGGDQDDQPEFAGPQAEVSGWVFNKGYRTVAETVTSKFPGIGVSLRELYHRGNDSSKALAIAPIEPVAAATVTTADTVASAPVVETPAAPADSGTAPVAASGTYIVGLSWSGLMRKAKSLAHTVSSTASAIQHSDIYRMASPVLAQVAPLVANYIPGGRTVYDAALKAHDLLVAAKKDHPEAVQAIATIRKWADDGDQPSLKLASVMQQMSNKLDEKAAALPPPAPAPAPMAMVRVPTYNTAPMVRYAPRPQYVARPHYEIQNTPSGDSYYRRGLRHRWMDKHVRHMHHQPQVSGWLYNKPYRGVLEAPGAGLVMRELYNRGEGHNPTTLGDVLRQVFPLGT